MALWTRIMLAEWMQTPELAAKLGMNTDEPEQEVMAFFKASVAQVRANVNDIIFLLKNRKALNRAQGAVRAEKMTKAWNLERLNRCHTLIEGQPNRALKELRVIEDWRLGLTAPPCDDSGLAAHAIWAPAIADSPNRLILNNPISSK